MKLRLIAKALMSKPLARDAVYEGRIISKPSLPSQCREMVETEIPKPEPGVIRDLLYPGKDSRAA